MQKLTVVIPAYNEANALRSGKLEKVNQWLEAQPFNSEILVVDDGSQDDTLMLAQHQAGRAISIPHAGKAAAILAGIRAAEGDVILFTDMDQATPISEAPKLLDAIARYGGVAIGSRGMVRKGAPISRYILSWGQIFLRRLLTGLKIADTQCGFKAMTREAAEEVLNHLRLYDPGKMSRLSGPSVTSGFDVEFLFVTQRLGYQITEIPVVWNYQDTSRVRVIRDAFRGVRDLLRITLADLRGAYPRRKS